MIWKTYLTWKIVFNPKVNKKRHQYKTIVVNYEQVNNSWSKCEKRLIEKFFLNLIRGQVVFSRKKDIPQIKVSDIESMTNTFIVIYLN